MAAEDEPARWSIGPPAPRWLAFLARACSLAVLVLIGHWVHVTLGGVAVKPDELSDGNDTGRLFNWHPILMTLGFVVFMAEALLSYQAPLVSGLARPERKRVHAVCNCVALGCCALGLAAVLQSHRLKRPAPMADWYSPHSYLGLAALGLAGVQLLVGCYAYLWPRLGLPQRLALGPLHRFGGAAVWLTGLAALASGVQEKTTFMQTGRGLSGAALYGAAVRVPAAILPLLVVLAAAVLYFQAQPAVRQSGGRQVAVSADGSGLGLAGSGEADEERHHLLEDGRRRV